MPLLFPTLHNHLENGLEGLEDIFLWAVRCWWGKLGCWLLGVQVGSCAKEKPNNLGLVGGGSQE